jgi:hypothetical protein
MNEKVWNLNQRYLGSFPIVWETFYRASSYTFGCGILYIFLPFHFLKKKISKGKSQILPKRFIVRFRWNFVRLFTDRRVIFGNFFSHFDQFSRKLYTIFHLKNFVFSYFFRIIFVLNKSIDVKVRKWKLTPPKNSTAPDLSKSANNFYLLVRIKKLY